MLYNIIAEDGALAVLRYNFKDNSLAYSCIDWVVHYLSTNTVTFITGFWSDNPDLRIICRWFDDTHTHLIVDTEVRRWYATPCSSISIDFIYTHIKHNHNADIILYQYCMTSYEFIKTILGK